MPIRVLVCDPIGQEGLRLLRSSAFEVVERFGIAQDELKLAIGSFDALIVRGRTKITREVLSSAKRLKLIGRAGVGLDNIDVEAAREMGIRVISTPDAPTVSVAELTIALMLSALRHIPLADRSMKDGSWIKPELMGHELRGKVVGIIGIGGRIGFEVARMALEGFKAKVIGYDIIDVREKAGALGFKVAGTLDELLRESDIISIHVPYIPSTHHLIDSPQLDSMKDGAILINTSRGDVINGRAVLEALRRGKLSAIGLDVYHTEPPSEQWEKELISLPNVICTPHIGAQTFRAQYLESVILAEEILRFFQGGLTGARGQDQVFKEVGTCL